MCFENLKWAIENEVIMAILDTAETQKELVAKVWKSGSTTLLPVSK